MNIQLALDRLTIQEAITIAKPIGPYVDWIEVGTSLIKEFGMDSVKGLRASFPDHTLVADIKTFDNVIYEFDLCFSAGADIVTIMGAAPLISIEAGMNAAAKRGKQVMIDLLNTSEEQVKQLSIYHDAIFCQHISKDQQELQGKQDISSDFGKLKIPQLLSNGNENKLALAGGITIDTLPLLVRSKPHAIIVGSAITKAAQPVVMAQAFQDVIRTNGGEL